MNHDLSAGVDSDLLRSSSIGGIGVGNVEREMIMAVIVLAVDHIWAFGRLAIAYA